MSTLASHLIYVAAIPVLAVASCIFYRKVNHGLSRSAIHQQSTRLSIASVLALAPSVAAAPEALSAQLIAAASFCLIQAVSYPLIHHLSHRRTSPDYDNFMDIAFGLYLYGILSSLIIAGSLTDLSAVTGVLAALIECGILLWAVFQWGYFILYKNAIDIRGMKIFYETHYNEVIEFGRSFHPIKLVIFLTALVSLLTGIFLINLLPAPATATGCVATGCVIFAVAGGIAFMAFYGHRSPFRRIGLSELYLNVADYARNNRRYLDEQRRRLDRLSVAPLKSDTTSPRTILLIIGESASRDHMSAFTPMEHDTTPWMRSMAEKNEMLIFPNAYSCAMHTVETLERALTQRNQYNNIPFLEAPSIIDVARKLGYRIHWYSNQGHLGANDTPVTLVAETSDVAKWTHQQLNKVQYDETLLEFLQELDPAVNNLLVVHLKGSHFNFLNRYPSDRTVWGEPGVQDNIPNFHNSLLYTDSVIRSIYDYCRKRLSLYAMVYLSDHATIPSRQRTVDFDGFGHVRIPLAVWLSEAFRREHPERTSALSDNRNRFFTNDLLFELMCGIFDITSPAFDESASLASYSYRFTPETLLTFNGTIHITDDPTLKNKA